MIKGAVEVIESKGSNCCARRTVTVDAKATSCLRQMITLRKYLPLDCKAMSRFKELKPASQFAYGRVSHTANSLGYV